jgi:hypothetical protein
MNKNFITKRKTTPERTTKQLKQGLQGIQQQNQMS